MDSIDEVSDGSNELPTPPPSPNTSHARQEATQDAIAALMDKQELLQNALETLSKRVDLIDGQCHSYASTIAVVVCVCIATSVAFIANIE